jgi:hypothetical protein
MGDEHRRIWEPEELKKVLAARRMEFDEQYKFLKAKLDKPFPALELTDLGKQIDANLKALQEHVRSLPRRDSISN